MIMRDSPVLINKSDDPMNCGNIHDVKIILMLLQPQ